MIGKLTSFDVEITNVPIFVNHDPTSIELSCGFRILFDTSKHEDYEDLYNALKFLFEEDDILEVVKRRKIDLKLESL